jgi:AraC-like DNA-binding protein
MFALAYIMLLFGYYVSGASGMTYEYIIQASGIILICYLLWRVETLQTLETHHRPLSVSEGSSQTQEQASELSTSLREGAGESLSEESQESLSLDALLSARNDIGPLLKQYCEEPQLYLKHDISLNELATMIGTNRTYLSNYFSLQGITYNTYINALRIQHFVTLCQKKAAANETITLRELVRDSGFRSYNTFNTAFKQNMGTTVTVWLHKLNFRY